MFRNEGNRRTKLIALTAICVAASFVSAALPGTAFADNLDSRKDVYYSKHTELASYSFGFDARPTRPCKYAVDGEESSDTGRQVARRYSSPKKSSWWNELSDYQLQDIPNAVSAMAYEKTPTVFPGGSRFTEVSKSFRGGGNSRGAGSLEGMMGRVQRISDTLVNSFAGWLKGYFGGESAYADSGIGSGGFGGGGVSVGGFGGSEVDFSGSDEIAAAVESGRDGLVHF